MLGPSKESTYLFVNKSNEYNAQHDFDPIFK